MIARFVRWAVASFALWLLLVTTLARTDVAAGVVAALLTAAVAAYLDRLGVVRWRFRLRWLSQLPRLAWQVLHDLAVLAVALVHPRRTRGQFRALPFDVGDDDPTNAGRRAVLTLAGSLGPNTFVVGYDRERNVVLVHQLVPNEQVLPIPRGRYPVRS